MENEQALVKTKSAQPAQTTQIAKSAINPQAIFQKQGLAGLEKIIQTSIQKTQKHLIRLSLCLKYIRDNKLYLPYYPDFETYFQEKFNLSKAQCLVFLQTAFVYERLLETGVEEELLPELRMAAVFYDTSRALVPAVPDSYFEQYLSGLVRFIWAITLATLTEKKTKQIRRIPNTHQSAVLKAVSEFFRLHPPEFVETSEFVESGKLLSIPDASQTQVILTDTFTDKIAENAQQLGGITVFLDSKQKKRLFEAIKQIKAEKAGKPKLNQQKTKKDRGLTTPVLNGDLSLLAFTCRHHELEVKLCKIQISQQHCFLNLSCGCRLAVPTKASYGFLSATKTTSEKLSAADSNETF